MVVGEEVRLVGGSAPIGPGRFEVEGCTAMDASSERPSTPAPVPGLLLERVPEDAVVGSELSSSSQRFTRSRSLVFCVGLAGVLAAGRGTSSSESNIISRRRRMSAFCLGVSKGPDLRGSSSSDESPLSTLSTATRFLRSASISFSMISDDGSPTLP